MEDYISSLQTFSRLITKLENCVQTYQYIQTFTPMIEEINFPFYEIIDSISCCDSALLTLYHFKEYPTSIPKHCQKDFQLLHDYYTKNKCSYTIFNTPYSFAFQHLQRLWQTAIVNNDITLFSTDLDSLRSYLHDYYGHRYQLSSFTYRELLVHIYDENFVFSHYATLFHHKAVLKNNYQLFLQDNIQVPLHELNFNQQQTLDFFNYFIQQSTFITTHYHINIEFHESSSKMTKFQNIRKISLSPYQNFVSSLFEFLDFYAQIYLEILSEKSALKNSIDFNSQSIIYYFQFLPILTSDFSKFLSQFLCSSKTLIRKKTRIIYNELLAQYIWLRPNPMQLQSMNPLTLFITKMMELEIEEYWFNQNFSSIQLPQLWNELSIYYFNRKPSHQMEASLRSTQWLNCQITKPFEQLVSILNVFDYRSFHTPKENSYEKFLAILKNGHLIEFARPCCLNFQELKDDSRMKSFLILIKQLQQQVIKRNK